MACPVKPVVGQVVGEESQHPMPPSATIQRIQPPLIQHVKKSEDESFCDEPRGYIAQSQRQAAKGIFCFVEMPPLPVGEPCFQAKQNDKAWYGVIENIGGHDKLLYKVQKKAAKKTAIGRLPDQEAPQVLRPEGNKTASV